MGVGGAWAARSEVDRLLDAIVADLPEDDVTGRLVRRRHVIDRLMLEFSRDAARLAAQFATEDAGTDSTHRPRASGSATTVKRRAASPTAASTLASNSLDSHGAPMR